MGHLPGLLKNSLRSESMPPMYLRHIEISDTPADHLREQIRPSLRTYLESLVAKEGFEIASVELTSSRGFSRSGLGGRCRSGRFQRLPAHNRVAINIVRSAVHMAQITLGLTWGSRHESWDP